MHKRLLGITPFRINRLATSVASRRLVHRTGLLTRVPRYFFTEPVNPNPKIQTTHNVSDNRGSLKGLTDSEFAKIEAPVQQAPDPFDEREQIRRLRQQIKKKETENTLGITTVQKKKTVLDHIKEGIASLKKSLKDLYKDGQYVYGLKKQKGSWKNLHLVEYIKYKNINYDLIKFFPYSFFLIVPLAEFALPFYILLLPNSTPTQFYSEKTIGERTQRMIIKQKEGYKVIEKKLYEAFGNDFVAVEKLCKVLRENPGDQVAVGQLRGLDQQIQKKLREEWEAYYSKSLGFYGLTIEEKEALLKVFYNEHISGIYIVNQLYNIPFMVYNLLAKYIKKSKVEINEERWKLNFFPIRHIKALMYRVQLLRHLSRVQKEDQLLFKNMQGELELCSSIELFELTRKRGFKIESDADCKEFLNKNWVQHSEIKNPDIRVWSIMLRHSYADYLI